MELNLGISAKRNPIQPGKRDYIKPDGLGLRRRDLSFFVIEAKGPQDDSDLLEATLQGLCGALAVYAKRKVIKEIARSQPDGSKRPGARVRGIPTQRRSLGIYVLVAAKGFKWEQRLEDYGQLILRSFSQLREIVYFKVDPSSCATFETLEPFRVLRAAAGQRDCRSPRR